MKNDFRKKLLAKSQELFNDIWTKKPSFADFDLEEREDRINK